MPALNKETMDDIDVHGKRVLLREDLNVPMRDGAIVDDRRVSPLDAALGRAGSADNHPSAEVAKILQTAIGQ